MARLEFFVVSRGVSVDQFTNQASIFEIIEEVHATSFPASIQSCVAMSLWRREPGDEEHDFQVLLRTTLPSGTIHDLRTNFRFTGPRHRITQRLEGLPIEQEGELRFEVLLNDEHGAEHIVDIHLSDSGDATELPGTPG